MPDIQVDMFEVQLGAAILLQFWTENGPVRVLADAGIKARSYQPDHVKRKLESILGNDRRIDLIIGTHYDEDHLNGLVPIIEDRGFEIREAWMPPIANDSIPHAIDASLSDENLLPHQFYRNEGDNHLNKYLSAKYEAYETILDIERKIGPDGQEKNRDIRSRDIRSQEKKDIITFFRRQLDQLLCQDDGFCHGIDQEIENTSEVEEIIRHFYGSRFPWYRFSEYPEFLIAYARMRSTGMETQLRSLTHIRKNIAKDAINAEALHKVIRALKTRKIPIRTEIIDTGKPRKYTWHATKRRFLAGTPGNGGPELMLLGPSRALVRKHWNRLPVEQAAMVALSFHSEIKSISPSNQLSYVARFGHKGQGILISGDAGCVDFKRPYGHYYKDILKEMLPLHIIQVAHHGGNNAHFYRVLDAAGFCQREARSLLLLSHAANDKKRPSQEFKSFVLSILEYRQDVGLLFTSRPLYANVEEYIHVICAAVSPSSDVGDIQIEFSHSTWTVKKHAIDAGALSVS